MFEDVATVLLNCKLLPLENDDYEVNDSDV